MSRNLSRAFRLAMALLVMALTFGAAKAQDRPVEASWTLGFGSAHLSDAYLAPFPTVGWGTALSYSRAQALKSHPEQWSRFLRADLDLVRTHTAHTPGNGAMWGGALTVEMGVLRRFAPLPFGLRLALGPSMEILAGAHYRPANGNNPVAAQAAVTFGIAARAAYSLHLGRLPIDLSLAPSLQLLGAFFAPAYGELYYEIYMGNHRNLAHFAWPGNRLSYAQLLAADLRLGSTSLRLGYRLRLASQEAAGLATNRVSHMFVIGITSSFLSIPRQRPSALPSDRVIYPFD